MKANYTHIFFKCPIIKTFWIEVEKATTCILDIKAHLTPENWLGINIQDKVKTKERKVFNILRLTALKQITRIWKQTKTPELKFWYKTVKEVFEMERLIYVTNGKMEKWNTDYLRFVDKVTGCSDSMV